jgi:hypothetical protein
MEVLIGGGGAKFTLGLGANVVFAEFVELLGGGFVEFIELFVPFVELLGGGAVPFIVSFVPLIGGPVESVLFGGGVVLLVLLVPF